MLIITCNNACVITQRRLSIFILLIYILQEIKWLSL
jgi:hypothetical protein